MATFTTANGTTFELSRVGASIYASARGLNLGAVRFDGREIETVWLVKEAGNKRISAPVPASALAEVAAMFAVLAADVAANSAAEAAYDAHVAGVKKMMNA